jgi:DNA-directed RNA polymerase specialized sigma24 family protein
MSKIEKSYTRYMVDGDVRALDDLLASARQIAATVAHRLGCEDADDIAQQASIIVWQKLRDYDPRLASLSTWIGTIVRRLVIDQYRSAPPRTTVLDETRLPEPPRVDYIALDVTNLGQKDRRTLAVFARNPNFDEAALTLGTTTSALKKRLHRIAAKNKLADLSRLATI